MPLYSPTNYSSKLISQYILALPLYIEPQPPLTRNQCWSYLNNFAYISLKDQKSNKRILEAYNKTYYIRSNTFSPYNCCIRTKSGSYVEVSFSILNRLLLLTLGFNSLGPSSDMPLTSLTIILPGHSLILVLMLNNQVEFKIILQLSIPPTIPSKLASNA